MHDTWSQYLLISLVISLGLDTIFNDFTNYHLVTKAQSLQIPWVFQEHSALAILESNYNVLCTEGVSRDIHWAKVHVLTPFSYSAFWESILHWIQNVVGFYAVVTIIEHPHIARPLFLFVDDLWYLLVWLRNFIQYSSSYHMFTQHIIDML